MASIVLASVGASVGNMILPGIGGRLLGVVSQRVGQNLDESWGWASSSEASSSQLESFKVQDSSYGVAIPVLFGQSRVAGNVIWASDLIETASKTSSSGKGGVLSRSSTTYTYSINCAVALCAGEIGSIQTIWADSKVLYADGVWASGAVESATIYTGSDDQDVDPLLESWIGEGLVPAYRGTAYIVFEGLQLSNYASRLPNLTFEILPKEATGQPEWVGTADPDIYHVIGANRNQAMQPITIEGGALCARTVIVGGYSVTSKKASFTVVEYDVTGDVPLELTRTTSASFSGADVGGHSWAMAADGRFVALGLQDGATGNPYSVVIYDAQARTFGAPVSVSMALAEARQIAWIDAQRFVVMGYENGKRGVYVFMRAGLSVVELGFFDVWGIGTQVSRVPEMYAQFAPYADGLLHFVVDKAPAFTLIEARYLSWVDNTLLVGDKINVASGVTTGNGNAGQAYLLRSGEEEVTLFYGTTLDMRLMSFTLGKTSVTGTRSWQTLVNTTISVVKCHAPVLIGSRIVVLQRASTENAYRLSEIRLENSRFSLASDGVVLEDFEDVGLNFGMVPISSVRLLASVNAGTSGDLGRLDSIKRRNTGDTLDNVVGAILKRAGYESGDYDVSALADIPVDGYVLSEQATGVSALQPLQVFEPFDLVERDAQLKAVLHGEGHAVALTSAEAGATSGMEADSFTPILVETRAQEIALPVEVSVDYEDVSRDYETGSQKARRGVTRGSCHVMKIVLSMVLSPTKAKRLAQDHLFAAWSERTQYRFYLSRAWLGVEPGDVVTLDQTRMRVTKVRLQDSVLRVDAISCPANALASTSFAEGGSGGVVGGSDAVASSLFLMDLPLLRSEDDAPGYYAAVSGLDGWPGASLWRSTDDVNFTQQASFASAAVAGCAVSLLPARAVAYRDQVSVLQVQLLQGELSSCSESALFNGANAALVGGEVLQFQTATLLGPGLYALGGLLRGRKGTEEQVGTHAIGESFVLLSSAALQFLPLQLSDRSLTYHFRAVSNGGSLDLAQDLSLTCGLKTIRPLAPAHLKACRASMGEVSLTWVRCARMNAAWVDYIDVPLDEAEELYDIEICDQASGDVVRSFIDQTDTTLIYTTAQQTADWGGGLPEAITVRVYQKSVRYGRGQAASVSVLF